MLHLSVVIHGSVAYIYKLHGALWAEAAVGVFSTVAKKDSDAEQCAKVLHIQVHLNMSTEHAGRVGSARSTSS